MLERIYCRVSTACFLWEMQNDEVAVGLCTFQIGRLCTIFSQQPR